MATGTCRRLEADQDSEEQAPSLRRQREAAVGELGRLVAASSALVLTAADWNFVPEPSGRHWPSVTGDAWPEPEHHPGHHLEGPALAPPGCSRAQGAGSAAPLGLPAAFEDGHAQCCGAPDTSGPGCRDRPFNDDRADAQGQPGMGRMRQILEASAMPFSRSYPRPGSGEFGGATYVVQLTLLGPQPPARTAYLMPPGSIWGRWRWTPSGAP